jgi:hypothetical protein
LGVRFPFRVISFFFFCEGKKFKFINFNFFLLIFQKKKRRERMWDSNPRPSECEAGTLTQHISLLEQDVGQIINLNSKNASIKVTESFSKQN